MRFPHPWKRLLEVAVSCSSVKEREKLAVVV